MKNKTFILMSLSILTLVFCLSFASADLTVSNVYGNSTSLYQNQGSFKIYFNLNNVGDAVNLNWSDSVIPQTSAGASFSFSTSNLAENSTANVTAIVSFNTNYVGTISGTIVAKTSTDSVSIPFSAQILQKPEAETCKYSDNGNLRIIIDDISVEKGYGKDNDWFLLDGIEVKVEIENRGEEKISDIVVEWGLYDRDADYWVIKEEEGDFNLKDGDEETLTLSFELDKVKKFREGGDYVFYVWATGEDEEFDDEETCARDFEEIEIVIEDDFVIIGDLSSVETASCGGEVTISANVWNIGEDDQDEVSVLIYNKELGLNKIVEIGDIDAFDSELLDFTFTIPKNLDEKTYTIKLTVYDEDNNVYENDYDDDKSIKDIFLKVEGGCSVAEASVIAVLESGGQAGKQMVIKATITNTGDKTTTYSLNAAGYADWASMAVLDKTLVTLESGKSQEVFVTFNVNKEISGEKLFVFEVISENEIVLSQPVSVDITKRSGLFGITGNVLSGDNKYVWGIGILNLILIILIIIIALRITRKK